MNEIKNHWKKIVVALAALVVTPLITAANCGGDTFRDLEGVKGKDPDAVQIIYNVDGYPNIVRICVDKVAFASTTRDNSPAALFRVPEWDVPFCGATPIAK